LSEPIVILCLTDGGPMLSSGSAGLKFDERLEVPGLRVPGCEYYFEPFRWDQRLITLFFRGRPPLLTADSFDKYTPAPTLEYWLHQLCLAMKGSS
jgi:hypothetical protein